MESPYKYLVDNKGTLTMAASITEVKNIFINESLLNSGLTKHLYLINPFK